ncbi:ribosome assembly factor SBDS [Candidatus Pacearchaeota archaeon]|nr:ribosome assembly factor SBDS [Candidatus Pacearchaeota archaeon]
MPKVTARIKAKGKHYEISVDLDEALKVRQGKGDVRIAVDVPKIFSDTRKGTAVSNADLMDAFGTIDPYQVATIIITKGEVQKTQEFRDTEKENKVKQLIQLIIKNAVDQNGRPYTEDRIKRAIEEVHYSIDNRPAEQQVVPLVDALKVAIPIKLEVKRIKLIIPAQYTGNVYGLLKDYKEDEEWLGNGSLQCVLAIPAGMTIDFFDKLNNITHGTVQSQELPSV